VRARLRLALALTLWGWVAAGVRADGVTLRTFLAEVKTLETAFEQVVQDEKGRRLEDSFGRFYLARPGRFRWSYTIPYVQEIVSDGEKVWIYDSELAQVTVRSAREALANAPGLLLSSDQPLDREFAIKDLGARDGLDWVGLTPKATEALFGEIRVGFRGRELAAMELVDGFGQRTTLRFKGTVRNPRIDATVFRFVPPPGVDVIEDAGRQGGAR
jgi:outer membrane lipoprotein carrier protein